MGDFRIEVNATGGHGCQREKGRGDRIEDCGQPGCPDCIARRFVAELVKSGSQVREATLTHWPGQDGDTRSKELVGSEVRDNLLTGIRRGDF